MLSFYPSVPLNTVEGVFVAYFESTSVIKYLSSVIDWKIAPISLQHNLQQKKTKKNISEYLKKRNKLID